MSCPPRPQPSCSWGPSAASRPWTRPIASTALVTASRGLGDGGGLLALAASISTLMLAATVISSGLLGDRIGWRRLLIGTLVLSLVADVVVARRPRPGGVPGGPGRGGGVGLGAVFAASFAYIRIITPKDRMARALGLYSASGSVDPGDVQLPRRPAGLGGVGVAFLIIPVASAVAILVARAVLRTGRRAEGPAGPGWARSCWPSGSSPSCSG